MRRNLALSLTSAGMKREPAAPVPNLRNTITEEQRARLLPAIFRNDPLYFDETINALGAMHSWPDAARYLTDFLEINRLNPYAKDVLEFTELIRRWFVQDEEDIP